MTTGQITAEGAAPWTPNRIGTATRALSEDFRRMVFIADHVDVWIGGGLIIPYLKLVLSAITPINPRVFDWEAAEKRADWEAANGRFSEFTNVRELLKDLHS